MPRDGSGLAKRRWHQGEFAHDVLSGAMPSGRRRRRFQTAMARSAKSSGSAIRPRPALSTLPKISGPVAPMRSARAAATLFLQTDEKRGGMPKGGGRPPVFAPGRGRWKESHRSPSKPPRWSCCNEWAPDLPRSRVADLAAPISHAVSLPPQPPPCFAQCKTAKRRQAPSA